MNVDSFFFNLMHYRVVYSVGTILFNIDYLYFVIKSTKFTLTVFDITKLNFSLGHIIIVVMFL